jgi:hypothetical protein
VNEVFIRQLVVFALSVALGLCCDAEAQDAKNTPGAPPADRPTEIAAGGTSESPLAIRVGSVDLRFGGFVDATGTIRSTNVGSGIATTFGSIPLDNTPQGHLSETRLSAQSSRATLLVSTQLGEAALTGYLEADFLGNPPANLNVTTNANTLRMRLLWLRYVRGRFEFIGGQSWSLLTPNRNGVSPLPNDLFYTQDLDANYQVGLTWARQPQFRFVAHLTDNAALGVSLENPQQYVGAGVVLPSSFNASQVDATGNTTTPNPFPDVISKLAWDGHRRKNQHIEVGAILRGFRTYQAAAGSSSTAAGHGLFAHVNFQPARAVHLIASAFESSGGGRYLFGLGPDFIVQPRGGISLIGARSTLAGLEVAARVHTMLFAYYGDVHFDRRVVRDETTGSDVGIGVVGVSAANASLQESTVGFNRTLYRDETHGAVQLIGQYSYLTRRPFWVPPGARMEADSHMLWIDVRFILP